MNSPNKLVRSLSASIWLLSISFLPTLCAQAITAANFGNVNLCAAGQTATSCSSSAVFNVDTASGVNISTLTEGEPDLDFQTVSKVCSLASCRVEVAFRPLHPGLRRGRLVIANLAGEITQFFNLYGVGVGGQLGFGFSQQVALLSNSSNLKAQALAVDGAGVVYYADKDAETVSMLKVDGTTETISAGFVASALALDAGGDLYIGDSTNNRLLKLTPARVLSNVMTNVDVQSLALDGPGNLLIADTVSNSILKLTPLGVKSTIAQGTYTAVTVNAAGDIFAVDAPYPAKIVEVAPVKQPIASGYPSTSLALDAAGSFYAQNQFTLLQLENGAAVPATGVVPASAVLDAAANIYYADHPLNRIVKVNRATTSIDLPAVPSNGFIGTGGAFEIENTGNAVMVGIVAAFAGDNSVAQANCETLQPGQTCLVSLNFPAYLAQSPQSLTVGFSSNGQFFSTAVPVTFSPVVSPTITIIEQKLTAGPTYTATVALAGATGTLTLSFPEGFSCSLPLSAGAVSCEFPSGINEETLTAVYSGNMSVAGTTAVFTQPNNSSAGTTTWDLSATTTGATSPVPPPPPPNCADTSSYDLCGGYDQ